MTFPIKELQTFGWCEFCLPSREHLLKQARAFGTPVSSRPGAPIIEQLIPRSKPDARPGSLSSIVGRSGMPMHTDAAYHQVPPRWVFLWSKDISLNCATIVFNPQRTLNEWAGLGLDRGIWGVSGGGAKFIVPAISRGVMRWDPNCMWPLDPSARRATSKLHGLLDDVSPEKINWDVPGKLLILDNWRVLHGREAAYNAPDRILLRILIRQT
jgi:hypothetical protein